MSNWVLWWQFLPEDIGNLLPDFHVLHPISKWNSYPRESFWRRGFWLIDVDHLQSGQLHMTTVCYWNSSFNGWFTLSFLKGTFLPWEPMEEAGSGNFFQLLPWDLKRGGGSIVRSEAHPLPRNPSEGDDSVAGVKAWPLPEIHMRKDLALNWRPNLFLSSIRDWHNPTPFLYHMRYSAHLLGYFFQKEVHLLQEGLYHSHYHFYYFEDFVLTSTCSPTIRPASVVYSLDSWTSSSTSKAIHVR